MSPKHQGLVEKLCGTAVSEGPQFCLECGCVLEADDFFAEDAVAIVKHRGGQAFDAAELLIEVINGEG